eukprot:comp19817_c0_seq1/m.23822 comp19817_c0_seq1/g.23822  ORF comp19817_c0_seq1/g.23822 comp19817_c0_seq1/m.23822 type:complete len:247 (-) comp19817_c0_seq1:654-1394(-)
MIQRICFAVLGAAVSVQAGCGCNSKTPTCSVLEKAENVIVANVERAETEGGRTLYAVTVSTSYKGNLPEGSSMQITTETGKCGVSSLSPGSAYILTVDTNENGHIISACGYNRPWGLFGARQRKDFEDGAALKCATSFRVARSTFDDAASAWLAGGPTSELSLHSSETTVEGVSSQVQTPTASFVSAPTPWPKRKKSCRNGDQRVADGWSGKGTGENSCNVCVCTNGVLACTKMMCLSRDGASEDS